MNLLLQNKHIGNKLGVLPLVENLCVFRTSFSEDICFYDLTLVLPYVCELLAG